MRPKAAPDPAALGRRHFVNRKRESLHRLSVQGATFDGLYQLLGTPAWVRTALDRILRNRGSKTPGVDGATRDDFKAEWSKQALVDEVVREMRSKSYQPSPIRRVYIPKPSDPSKQRPLGIATLKDRVVQEAVRMILEPIYEPRFYPHSYGFRPFRSAHHALARIHYLATAPRKYEWVVEGDIRDCFGSIDHGILLRMMRQTIHDRPLLHVMQEMLKAGVLDGLAYHEPEGGSPQGSVVSPLWANIYLTALDRFVAAKYASQEVNLRRREAARGQTVPCDIVRYADDFVIMVRGSQQDAERIKADVARFLQEELHMDLSLEKTLVTHITDGFDFLGYEMRAVDHGSKRVVFTRPSKKSKERFRAKVRDMLRRMICMPREAALIASLNRLVRGWCLYFAHGSSASTFRGLERWLTRLVSKALYKKHRGRHYRSRKLHHREFWIPFRFSIRDETRWHNGAGLGVWLDVRRTRALHLWRPSHTRIVYTHQFGRYDAYDPADRALLLSRRMANRQRGRTERLGPKRQSQG